MPKTSALDRSATLPRKILHIRPQNQNIANTSKIFARYPICIAVILICNLRTNYINNDAVIVYMKREKNYLAAVGFEPTPFRTGA